jgi:hypothetical protein
VVIYLVIGSILICCSVIGLIVYWFSKAPTIQAQNPLIGFELSESGHLNQDVRIIPSDAQNIYIGFNFEAVPGSSNPLEFRWFRNHEILMVYSNNFSPGYVQSMMTRDPAILDEFPSGDYIVEVWYINTALLSESFTVK